MFGKLRDLSEATHGKRNGGKPGKAATWRQPWLYYLLATAVTAATFFLRLALSTWIGTDRPVLILLEIPIVISAYLGGMGPALLSTALVAVGSYYFVLPPVSTFQIARSVDLMQWTVMVACGSLISIMSGMLYHSRQRAVANEGILGATIASIADGIITTNPQGQITFLNEEAERIGGWSCAEAVGRPLDDIFRIIEQKTHEPVGHWIEQALRQEGREKSVDRYLLLARDGREIPIDLCASPVKLADGTVHGSVLVFSDSSVRKQAEQALRESEENFKGMFEVASIGIAQADPKTGRWLRVNRKMCEITGYSSAELLTLRIPEVTHPDDRERDWQAFHSVKDGKLDSYHLDKRYIRKDGKIIWVNVNMTVIRDSSGQPHRTIATIEEITERKLAEEALSESEQFKNAILDSVRSHIAVLDTDGVILSVNQPWVRFSVENGTVEGFPARRTESGVNYLDICRNSLGESAEGAMAAHDGIIAVMEGTLPSFTLEYPCHAPGVKRWFIMTVTPLGDGKKGVVVSHADITDRKMAEEALKLSEERFHTIFHTSPVSAALTRLSDNKLMDVNEAWLKATGLAWQEAVGHTPAELNLWVDPGQRDALVGLLLERKIVHDFEIQFRHKSGFISSLLLSAGLIELGGEQYVLSLAQDITARRRSEEALKEREEIYRAIVDQAVEGIVLIDLATFRFAEFNDAACHGLGYSREEFARLTLFDVQGILASEEVIQHIQAIAQAGQGGFENQQRRKDGTLRDVMVSNRVVNVRGHGYIAGIWQDITERKRAETALRESEERFRALFEQAAVGVAQIETPTGRFLTVNNRYCEIVGYSREEMLGKTFQVLTHPDDLPADLNNMARLCRNEIREFSMEKRYFHKNGSMKWVNLTVSPLWQPGEEPTFHVAIVEDITERKQAEEEKQQLEAQLRQAHKMEAVGTLAGGIAHEFNNVLGIILGNAELAKDDIPEWSPARFNLDEIKGASLRARDVVRQLLTFSRKGEENQQPLDLALVVKDAVKFLRSSIPTTVEIRQNITDTCHTVIADPTQIHQVLLNLSTNAVHAMEETGGVLQFSLQNTTLGSTGQGPEAGLRPGEYVLLQVSDTGTGIPAEILERIFDPYFTTKEVGKGTGMGLAMVHGIVEAHGGSIQVESHPGSGTTFKIFYPAAKEKSRVLPALEEELPTGTERILFVDDETSIATLGALMLARLGYQAQAETNPTKALETFAADPEQFDLIITDTTMPGMTGDQLIKKVLQIRPNMKTILCTGYSQRIDEELARNIGARAYAIKPLDKKELARTVRKVLNEIT